MQYAKIAFIITCLFFIPIKKGYSTPVGPIYAFTHMNAPVLINPHEHITKSVKTKIIKTKISSNPSNGKVLLNNNNSITYVPDRGYTGTDTAIVVIEAKDNIIHVATTKITVGEPSPESKKTVTLEWPPSPDEYLLGYEIFYGPSLDRISEKLPESYTELVSLKNPFLVLDVEKQLYMEDHNQVCFQIIAHNTIGESDPYETICKDIDDN